MMNSPGQSGDLAMAPRVAEPQISVGLTAAIVAVEALTPLILTVDPPGPEDKRDGFASLPAGPFSPLDHRTLEIGLRAWVSAQTNLQIGYAEQLYTFGDRGRHAEPGDTGPHVMSVGYLALTRIPADAGRHEGAHWRSWYDYFPWEDWREGRPAILDRDILPNLERWSMKKEANRRSAPNGTRRQRIRLAFGGGDNWDEELVLDRYEILYEAGLVEESARDGREAANIWPTRPAAGAPMQYDHRRILATAISRLRGKIKYRPVVFELLPDAFTLTQLQQTVEAIGGRHLHKQNFRRLVAQANVVEPTGATEPSTGGRPAALYRYRRQAIEERPRAGLRV